MVSILSYNNKLNNEASGIYLNILSIIRNDVLKKKKYNNWDSFKYFWFGVGLYICGIIIWLSAQIYKFSNNIFKNIDKIK